MLVFLLDEHISPKVSSQLQQKNAKIIVRTLQTWENGLYLQASDEKIINAASKQSLTLVTYDLKTIPPLLNKLAEEEQSHAGIIFVNEQTISSSNIGRLVKALHALWEKNHEQDWMNRCVYLSKSQ
ncbi:MAG: DUF5615 family PIN-like protein [Cyanobacteria bacterium J06643_4]